MIINIESNFLLNYYPGNFKSADIDTLDDLKNAKKLFK